MLFFPKARGILPFLRANDPFSHIGPWRRELRPAGHMDKKANEIKEPAEKPRISYGMKQVL